VIGTWRYETARTSAILHRADDTLTLEIGEKLPLGSDRSLVERFLELHSIPTNGGYFKLGTSDRELYDGASAILDTATNKVGTRAFSCRIHLTFRFDESDKLLGYSHKPRCEAPF
jgi:hypothetical protein